MNLNEKCLLKFLTNPISSFTKDDEKNSNVIVNNDFNYFNHYDMQLKDVSLIK